ncbi:hypothetical protein WJX77_011482 [Trebouxia sp. C0004]
MKPLMKQENFRLTFQLRLQASEGDRQLAPKNLSRFLCHYIIFLYCSADDSGPKGTAVSRYCHLRIPLHEHSEQQVQSPWSQASAL